MQGNYSFTLQQPLLDYPFTGGEGILESIIGLFGTLIQHAEKLALRPPWRLDKYFTPKHNLGPTPGPVPDVCS